MVLNEDSDVDVELPVPFSAALYLPMIYYYGCVDSSNVSADGLDSLLKLCRIGYYNTVFRLPCYSH